MEAQISTAHVLTEESIRRNQKETQNGTVVLKIMTFKSIEATLVTCQSVMGGL